MFRVFSRSAYVLLAASIGILTFTLITWVPQLNLTGTFLFGSHSLPEGVRLAVMLLGSPLIDRTLGDFLLTASIAIHIGMNCALFLFSFRVSRLAGAAVKFSFFAGRAVRFPASGAFIS